MKKLFSLILLTLTTSVLCFAQSNSDDILGVWISETGKAHVRVDKINGQYFGRIIWLREPIEFGKPKLDKNNSDKIKKTAPMMGLRLLNFFKFDGDGVWNEGTIYDPENGKTYSCKITMKEKNKLNIRGYIGISLIGRTSIWKRVQ